jgi:hypothetical protein
MISLFGFDGLSIRKATHEKTNYVLVSLFPPPMFLLKAALYPTPDKGQIWMEWKAYMGKAGSTAILPSDPVRFT